MRTVVERRTGILGSTDWYSASTVDPGEFTRDDGKSSLTHQQVAMNGRDRFCRGLRGAVDVEPGVKGYMPIKSRDGESLLCGGDRLSELIRDRVVGGMFTVSGKTVVAGSPIRVIQSRQFGFPFTLRLERFTNGTCGSLRLRQFLLPLGIKVSKG